MSMDDWSGEVGTSTGMNHTLKILVVFLLVGVGSQPLGGCWGGTIYEHWFFHDGGYSETTVQDHPPRDATAWDPGDAEPAPDFSRDILATELALDLTTLHGVAAVTIAGSLTSVHASFEIGDLTLISVRGESNPLRYAIREGPPRRVDVVVPPSEGPTRIIFDYLFREHSQEHFDGWMPESGATFLWPTFCGNLFPCKSTPEDGTTFIASITGVPDGFIAVFPSRIPAPAPSYMFGIAVGRYVYHALGATRAGTEVGVYTYPGDTEGIAATASLRDIFDWYEQTLGPYPFGSNVASVAVDWGPGDYGGMEHHPFWHVGRDSMGSETTHAHEAAHGWYGNGVRIRCWEDFVLSEGTVTYLAAEAITAVRGISRGEEVWRTYASRLQSALWYGDTVAYPEGCNQIDLLHHPLWSGIPYYKGAFFYRAVAEKIGKQALLGVLSRFYIERMGTAASMQDMLDEIYVQTGFDPAPLANAWLRSLGHP